MTSDHFVTFFCPSCAENYVNNYFILFQNIDTILDCTIITHRHYRQSPNHGTVPNPRRNRGDRGRDRRQVYRRGGNPSFEPFFFRGTRTRVRDPGPGHATHPVNPSFEPFFFRGTRTRVRDPGPEHATHPVNPSFEPFLFRPPGIPTAVDECLRSDRRNPRPSARDAWCS